MAVCRLAILSYSLNEDLGGYDIQDLEDCIAFARWSLGLGIKTGFDGQDWRSFINWAKRKLAYYNKESKDV